MPLSRFSATNLPVIQLPSPTQSSMDCLSTLHCFATSSATSSMLAAR
ncbi:hypothetical protein EVA_07789 [gut metagenome]|uniref:Uncharacterized protein n=1 Tax=gut metagenome TaxID=749906 RepID=J9GA10_9ZZZZ